MIQGIPSWWILVGICALIPPNTPQEGLETPKTGKEELGSPKTGMEEELGSPKTGREELGSPKTGREELGSPKTGREELGFPKTGMEELGSPKTGKEELGSPFPRDGDPLQDSQRCSITFHTPNSCPSPDPSRESRRDLDHLQELLEDTKATLRDLEVLATREDNGTRYRDVIAQALPAIHEANLEFRESLENIHRELEEHVARVEHPRVLEQREELRRGLRVVSHVLLLTARLARGLEGTARGIQEQLRAQGIHARGIQEQLRAQGIHAQGIHARSSSGDTEP